jgi:hypothetical protein
MDPDQALADLLAAERRGHSWQAAECADALGEWLAKGGFPPRHPEYIAILGSYGYDASKVLPGLSRVTNTERK